MEPPEEQAMPPLFKTSCLFTIFLSNKEGGESRLFFPLVHGQPPSHGTKHPIDPAHRCLWWQRRHLWHLFVFLFPPAWMELLCWQAGCRRVADSQRCSSVPCLSARCPPPKHCNIAICGPTQRRNKWVGLLAKWILTFLNALQYVAKLHDRSNNWKYINIFGMHSRAFGYIWDFIHNVTN